MRSSSSKQQAPPPSDPPQEGPGTKPEYQPTPEEIAEAGEIYDLGVPSGDAVFPFRAVIQFVLTAPAFLYRTEIGPNGSAAQTAYKLTDHEVASFLSYSLMGQPPSAALLAPPSATTPTPPPCQKL